MNHIVGESPGRGGRGISRRTLLGRSVAALGMLAAPYVVTSRAAVSRQVVVRTSGGGYDAARREAVYEAFQKETGIEVVLVAASSAKLVAMAKAGDKGIDVVDTNDNVLLELDRLGALEPMDYAIPANRKALPAVAPQLVDPATNDLWVRSKGFLKNVEWWADNKSLVAERWSTWVVQ